MWGLQPCPVRHEQYYTLFRPLAYAWVYSTTAFSLLGGLFPLDTVSAFILTITGVGIHWELSASQRLILTRLRSQRSLFLSGRIQLESEPHSRYCRNRVCHYVYRCRWIGYVYLQMRSLYAFHWNGQVDRQHIVFSCRQTCWPRFWKLLDCLFNHVLDKPGMRLQLFYAGLLLKLLTMNTATVTGIRIRNFAY